MGSLMLPLRTASLNLTTKLQNNKTMSISEKIDKFTEECRVDTSDAPNVIMTRLELAESQNGILSAYRGCSDDTFWTSTEEGLPPFGQRVFVLYKPVHPVMEEVLPGTDYRREVKGTSLEGTRIGNTILENKGFMSSVLYWAPIPPRPEQKQQNNLK